MQNKHLSYTWNTHNKHFIIASQGIFPSKGTLGSKSIRCRDEHSFTQAHYTVLHNSTLAASYIKEHKNIVRSNNPGKHDSLIHDEHMKTFGGWLQTHLMNNNTVCDELYLLASSPSSNIWT